ncbi:MAG TPA: AAA family ATPase, partial [Pyrinomonadaceae bacterium]|nr:AAA family ATPase [Pyrinomonadaceae bacterium]
MRDEYTQIHDDDSFDEEAEARERYPFLYDDDDQGEADEPAKHANEAETTETTETTESIETSEDDDPEETEEQDEFAGQPDYHLLPHLPDEVLPRMRYRRYDSIFTASPAYLYFTNPKFNDRRPRLLGRFWAEGEVAVLFSDTGAGKSILATQIAQSIASGVAIGGFELDVPRQRVVYFDLELTREQFDRRYSNDDPHAPAKFPFHRNFIRSQPRP